MSYNITDPTIIGDIAVNIDINMRKSFKDFDIQELFRIRQKDNTRANQQFYIDVNDRAALKNAIQKIKRTFCSEYIHPIIQKKLSLKEGERPQYLDGLWMIAFAYKFSVSLTTGQDDSKTTKLTQSDSIFADNFKRVQFQTIKRLEKDDFKENITLMETFIRRRMHHMDYEAAALILDTLLMECVALTDLFDEINKRDPKESAINTKMNQFLEMIGDFFISLLENYEDSQGTYIFENSRLIYEPACLQGRTAFALCHCFSSSPAPQHLSPTITMPNNASKELYVSLAKGGIEKALVGGTISNGLRIDENFKHLDVLFKLVFQQIINNHFSAYFLSSSEKTLFFMLPVSSGHWKGNDDVVTLVGAPLKYMLIDHKSTQDLDNWSLQVMIFLKMFDQILKISPDNLGFEIGADYNRLDTTEDDDEYPEFMQSLISEGFIDSRTREYDLTPTYERPNRQDKSDDFDMNNSDEEARGSHGSRRGCRGISEEIGNLFPVNIVVDVENKILHEFSNTKSIKLHAPSLECLKHFRMRCQLDLNDNPKFFVKIFDIYQIQHLQEVVYHGYPEKYDDKLDSHKSDINVMSLIYNYKFKNYKPLKHDILSSYLREIIALHRLEIWNNNNPNNQIRTPKMINFGWGTFNIPDSHSYGGPFIVMEKLPFINRNQTENIPERIQSLEHQIDMLGRAGIEHNDLESRNICFDDNDNCFIVDFGMSVVDNDSILKTYDVSDIRALGIS